MAKGAKVKLFDAITALFQIRVPAQGADGEEDYAAFLAAHAPDEAELARQRAYAPEKPPRFILSISGGRAREAAKTAASLEEQTYRHFELTDEPLAAKGDYVLSLRAGDMLTPDTLYRFARRIEYKPDAKLLYADEDSLVRGCRVNPVFKPDYSEVTALSYDLFGAPLIVAKPVYDACAPSKAGDAPTSAQSYAFALRCLARAKGAEHIARVLLTRANPPTPPGNLEGCEAIEAYLKSTGKKCAASAGLWQGSFHVRAKPRGKEKYAVIIPNRDGADELRRLLESVEEACAFYEPQLVIADGGSTSERTLKYYELLRKNGAAKIVTVAGGGFSGLCNAAAKETAAENLLFLARDAELYTPDLIGEMRAQAHRPGAGAVGCLLTDGNGRFAHAGFVVGLGGTLASPYEGEAEDECPPRKLLFTRTVQGVSAVSGACMFIRAQVFREAGGFDEGFDTPDGALLPCGADAELCLRLMRKGYTNIFTPYARAMLHARLPRIEQAPEEARMRFHEAFKPMLAGGDPYFNRNFSMRSTIPRAKTQSEDET